MQNYDWLKAFEMSPCPSQKWRQGVLQGKAALCSLCPAHWWQTQEAVTLRVNKVQNTQCALLVCVSRCQQPLSSAFPRACLSWLHGYLWILEGVFRSKIGLVLIYLDFMFSQPTLHFQNLHRRIDLIQEVSGSLLEVVPPSGLTTWGHPDKECFILAQRLGA